MISKIISKCVEQVNSDAALATVVDAFVEVPAMLWLVAIANKTYRQVVSTNG